MKTKAGLFGIGLNTYWSQFDGLLTNLKSYQQYIRKKIESFDVEVIDAGMVDAPDKAIEAVDLLTASDIDIVFLYISTYALSSTVLPIAQRLKAPIVLLNLQPVAQLDYKTFNALSDRGKMTGIWLEHCQACSVPEIASVFNRSGIRYDIVTGYLQDIQIWNEIEAWTDAARVAKALRKNRMGILGHYYGGMLDVYTDLTRHSAVFGTHFEMLEMCELKRYRDEVTPEQLEAKISEFQSTFDIDPECGQDEIKRACPYIGCP